MHSNIEIFNILNIYDETETLKSHEDRSRLVTTETLRKKLTTFNFKILLIKLLSNIYMTQVRTNAFCYENIIAYL